MPKKPSEKLRRQEGKGNMWPFKNKKNGMFMGISI